MIKRLAAFVAALGLMLIVTAPAFAGTYPLHQGENIAWNDSSIEVDCTGVTVPSGMVDWHFVAHTTTDDFTMTASFVDASGNVTNLSPDKVLDSYELQWDVMTTLTTLQSASITGSGTLNTGGFNLSHVCPNPPNEVPEAPAAGLLLLSGLVGVGFVAWRMRQDRTRA